MRKATLVITAALLAASASAARAQSVTVPSRVDVGCGFVRNDTTAGLTAAYRGGDGPAFRRHLTAILTTVFAACPTIKDTGVNPARDVIHVLWVDRDPLGSGKVVNHVVLKKDDDDLFNATLPGVTGADRVFEIFFAVRQKDAIATTYASTRERDPLEAQLPAFAKTIVDPLTTLLAGTQAALRNREAAALERAGLVEKPPLPPTHFVTMSRVNLPYARAKVHVEVRVALSPPDKAQIEEAATELAAANAFTTAAHSTCGQTLNTQLAKAVKDKAATCGGDPDACVPALTPLFNSEFKTTIAACTTERERSELMAVDTSFRDFIGSLTGPKVSAAFDLKNTPKRRATLGVMTGYAFAGSVKGAMRVKVKDGNLVADPLDRRLGLVVVNFGFKPYDEDAFHPTKAERFRWFAGAVITPDFGAAIGLSAGIVRGLTVNVGGALLGVRGKHAEDVLGKPPSHDEDPFKLSHARVLFLGVGYNFE
jgi:hypothetical protein